jgi:ABC-type nitrate/sulfonate/bicarbonate transport system ATPase subunit
MTVELKNVSKSFNARGGEVKAVCDLSLQAGRGQFVSLIGPSGCGKSTVFRIICGLLEPDRGEVLINGRPCRKPGDVLSYMPQKDLLMPWRTVTDNVILPLEISGVDRDRARERAVQLLPLFGLEGFGNSYPSDLSGGMSQRAALLRTVLAGRDIIMLDEPFGALDAITRFRMQQWLQNIWMKFEKTVIFITHDVEEAIFLSDRIYVMTPRPGTVKEEIAVHFPRPRAPGIVTDEGFVKLKEALLKMLAF